jgi:hypothetical protein
MEVGRLSEEAEGFVSIFLDVLDEQIGVKKAAIIRSNGLGIVELIVSCIAHDFMNGEWRGSANEKVIVHEVAKVFKHFSVLVCQAYTFNKTRKNFGHLKSINGTGVDGVEDECCSCEGYKPFSKSAMFTLGPFMDPFTFLANGFWRVICYFWKLLGQDRYRT